MHLGLCHGALVQQWLGCVRARVCAPAVRAATAPCTAHSQWRSSRRLTTQTTCQQQAKQKEARNTATLPLDGITVVDLTRVLAGPYATMMLADQGADVIKIERPGLGDETRQWGPPFAGDQSTYFLSVNRNKRSIAIDLTDPEGLAVVHRLIATADVLVENYFPGKLDQLGLGWDTVREINPRLVYASISGYGSTGPYAGRGGYDVVASAVGGLMHITGPAGGEPCKVGVAMTDLSTGLYLHAAVLAALLSRERTGVGMRIECSLLETQVASLVNVASAYLNAGAESTRLGTAHASIVPYQAFSTADGHIVVAAMNDAQFSKLCSVMDLGGFKDDPLYATNPARVANRDALLAVLQARFSDQTTAEWGAALEDSGLAFGPINTIEQVFEDPQVLHRNMVAEMEHATAGTVRVPAMAVKYTPSGEGHQSPNDVPPSAPPRLGQHTRDLLADLGFTLQETERLERRGVVSQATPAGDLP
eukprot:m.212791 g.212791  ORF g.212791 m.212791 type:complete len:477 (-) comp25540_c0_seq3:96-1526(-)